MKKLPIAEIIRKLFGGDPWGRQFFFNYFWGRRGVYIYDANIEKDRRRLRRMMVPAAGDESPRRATPLFEG